MKSLFPYRKLFGLSELAMVKKVFQNSWKRKLDFGYQEKFENILTKKFLKNPIKGTKYAIMVSSAKGGVGKSTFAINLAFSLQNLGKKIGLLDADVYGPSLTKLIGRNEKPKSEDGKFLHPIEHHGLQCISMGFLIELILILWTLSFV